MAASIPLHYRWRVEWHPCLLPSGGKTAKMLGLEGWERPEHDDRNPIKGISMVMLALQAFLLCARVFATGHLKETKGFASFWPQKEGHAPARGGEKEGWEKGTLL